MTTVVQICNLALGRIGVSQYIEDINDQNVNARSCKQFYDLCRQQVLQDFPWNFARGVVALAELADDPPPGWGYVYRYPTDCLQARAISDESGVRSSTWNTRQFLSWDQWAATIPRRQSWQVMGDTNQPGARIIITDIPEAFLWYTVDVDQVNQFTPLFASALAWKLAFELCGAIKADARLRDAAAQQYEFEKSKAAANSMNEETPDPAPDSPSILARL